MTGVCLWLEYYGLQLFTPYFQDVAFHGGMLFNYIAQNDVAWLNFLGFPPNPDRPLLSKSLDCAINQVRIKCKIDDNVPRPSKKQKAKYINIL